MRHEGSEAFAFLTEDAGFMGPEQIEHGISYHHADLCIDVCYFDYDGHDPEIVTLLAARASDGTLAPSVSLDDAYVAADLGSAQEVPGSAESSHAVRTRLLQHARALRSLLPLLHDGRAPHVLRRAGLGR